jgi:hypothetical protein
LQLAQADMNVSEWSTEHFFYTHAVERYDAQHVNPRLAAELIGLKAVGKVDQVLRCLRPQSTHTQDSARRSFLPYARAPSLKRIRMHSM